MQLRVLWIAACSIVFYSQSGLYNLSILCLSLVVTGCIARTIHRATSQAWKTALASAGIVFNLLVLFYFKYMWLVLGQFGSGFPSIVLPVGISFITFKQIAYLADTRKGLVDTFNWPEYIAFITFYPELIAGPILHHSEVIPQFRTTVLGAHQIAAGLSYFAIGLIKKVFLADTFAKYASPVFNAAATGYEPSLWEAWGAVLAYTLQIYFDFSAYSDMAVGLGVMLGVKVPINFASPYKARNIIDFWRRWHITLSRFLRNYLYVPLGGSRAGELRTFTNIFITMVLGGIWHGAGLTFLIWGIIHGCLITANHALVRLKAPPLPRLIAVPTTFLLVALAWVPFRAENVETILRMYNGMIGAGGIPLPSAVVGYLSRWMDGLVAQNLGMLDPVALLTLIPLGLLIVFFMPNSHQIMAASEASLPSRGYPATYILKPAESGALLWRPSRPWAVYTAVMIFLGSLYLFRVSEFIYFQF